MRIKSSAMFAARRRRARLCDAGRGADPGPHQGDGLHQARLPRRCTAILVREFGGQARRLHDRAVPAHRRRAQEGAGLPQLNVTVRAGGHGLAHVRARQRAHRPAVFTEQCHAGQAQGSVVLDSGVRRWDSRGHDDRRRGQAAGRDRSGREGTADDTRMARIAGFTSAERHDIRGRYRHGVGEMARRAAPEAGRRRESRAGCGLSHRHAPAAGTQGRRVLWRSAR